MQTSGLETRPKKLRLQEYEFSDTLGNGGFGVVRLAKDKRTNESVAVKVMQKSAIIQSQQTDHVLNEIRIHSSLSHPFIVNIRGLAQDQRALYLVMEYISGGELFTYLRAQRRLAVPEARHFVAQMVLVLEYLHEQNVIYRDLKPENILLDATGYAKLADFGFAKICPERTYTFCGTSEYLAPEIVLNKGHGKPVDWWTIGILLYELLFGIDPFHDEDPLKVYEKILQGKLRFFKSFDANARSLIKHLVQGDLSKRYGNLKKGVADIKRHRFFEGLDWDKLLRHELPAAYVPPPKSRERIHTPALKRTSIAQGDPINTTEDPFAIWQS